MVDLAALNPKLFNSWRGMLERCNNPNHVRYHRYGGRGVSVCTRWRKFKNFLEDMGPTWKEGLTIERMNNSGNYEPGNCTWESQMGQMRNYCLNHSVDTPKGDMLLVDASEVSRIHRTTLYSRIKAGWPTEHLFMKPKFGNRVS